MRLLFPMEKSQIPGRSFAENREPMLRVVRNHRRAAYGERAGYEELAIPPVPLDHANCPDPALVTYECRPVASASGSPSGVRIGSPPSMYRSSPSAQR